MLKSSISALPKSSLLSRVCFADLPFLSHYREKTRFTRRPGGSIMKKPNPLNKYGEKKIDPSRFKLGEPVSGTKVFNEDLAATMNDKTFDLDLQHITSRGFNRLQKPYSPPSDAETIFLDIVKQNVPSLGSKNEVELKATTFADAKEKFIVLSEVEKMFKHEIPSSLLYQITTYGEAIEYYKMPISINTPYDELVKANDLPQNLHLQKDYIRFHPDTDSKFNGISAFPLTSTKVTGLYAKKKYKGFNSRMYWDPLK